ncbi:MAG: hypothetical protein ACK5RL_10510 [Acidimicrobiales bacterium]
MAWPPAPIVSFQPTYERLDGRMSAEDEAAYGKLHLELAARLREREGDDAPTRLRPSDMWDRFFGPAVTDEQWAHRTEWCTRLGQQVD